MKAFILLPPDHFQLSLFPQLDHYTVFICGPKSKGLSQAIQMFNRNNNCRKYLAGNTSIEAVIVLPRLCIIRILELARLH
jgi:hypothetical protein